MKEAEGHYGIPVLNTKPGAEDPDSVSGDGDGNACQSKNGAANEGLFKKVPIEDCEGK